MPSRGSTCRQGERGSARNVGDVLVVREGCRALWGARHFVFPRLFVRRYAGKTALYQPVHGTLRFLPNEVIDRLRGVQRRQGSIRFADIVELEAVFPEYDWYRQATDLAYDHFLSDAHGRDDECFLAAWTKGLAQRTPELGVIYLFLTLDCNLRCAYCSVRKPEYLARMQRHSMDRAMLRRIVGFLDRYSFQDPSPKQIICFGGEPLLEFGLIEDLARLVDASSKSSRNNWTPYNVSIVTNGLLASRRMASFCAAYDIAVGVSIDGLSTRAVAQRSTRKGYAKELLANIELLDRYGVLNVFNTTVTTENIAQIPPLLRKLSRMTAARSLSLNRMHFSTPANVALYPEVEKHRAAYDDLFDTAERCGFEIREVTAMRDHLLDGTICEAVCMGNGRLMAVDPDGNVTPCPAMCGVRGQSVRLQDGDRAMASALFRRWRKRTPHRMGSPCDDCDILAICGGGCMANSHFLHRDITVPHSQGCAWRRYLFERAVDRIARDVGADRT